jgi:hypothetical protein
VNRALFVLAIDAARLTQSLIQGQKLASAKAILKCRNWEIADVLE